MSEEGLCVKKDMFVRMSVPVDVISISGVVRAVVTSIVKSDMSADPMPMVSRLF